MTYAQLKEERVKTSTPREEEKPREEKDEKPKGEEERRREERNKERMGSTTEVYKMKRFNGCEEHR